MGFTVVELLAVIAIIGSCDKQSSIRIRRTFLIEAQFRAMRPANVSSQLTSCAIAI